MDSRFLRNLRNLLLAALFVVAAPAGAGAKDSREVVINDVARSASGSLDAVRNSADDRQYIDCQIYAIGTIEGIIQCSATNSAGLRRRCTTANPDFVKAVQMINQTSWISFWWEAGTANCVNIQVRNSSRHLP